MDLTREEIAKLKGLAKGMHGRILIDYSKRLLAEVSDITKVPDDKFEVYKEVATIIKDNYVDFFDRLKQEGKHVDPSWENE